MKGRLSVLHGSWVAGRDVGGRAGDPGATETSASIVGDRYCRLGQRVTHAKHRLTEKGRGQSKCSVVHAGSEVYGRMVESTVYGVEWGADRYSNIYRLYAVPCERACLL